MVSIDRSGERASEQERKRWFAMKLGANKNTWHGHGGDTNTNTHTRDHLLTYGSNTGQRGRRASLASTHDVTGWPQAVSWCTLTWEKFVEERPFLSSQQRITASYGQPSKLK